tara:strand:- start:243 stop:455 length:213 start_codon:yes stop_codon:yes gene_type:complete
VTVKPHVRGRREIDGIELRRHLVSVVLRAWFPVGDRVHHLKVVVAGRAEQKKFGGKMKQTLEKKKRDERA